MDGHALPRNRIYGVRIVWNQPADSHLDQPLPALPVAIVKLLDERVQRRVVELLVHEVITPTETRRAEFGAQSEPKYDVVKIALFRSGGRSAFCKESKGGRLHVLHFICPL